LKKGLQFISLVGREVVARTQNGAARQTYDLQSGFQNADVDVAGGVSRQNPRIPPACTITTALIFSLIPLGDNAIGGFPSLLLPLRARLRFPRLRVQLQ
jgi:hypothetical protein